MDEIIGLRKDNADLRQENRRLRTRLGEEAEKQAVYVHSRLRSMLFSLFAGTPVEESMP